MLPLGDLCGIEIGGTPPRSQLRYWDERKSTNNVWLSIADLPKSLHARMSKSAEHLSDEGASRVRVVKARTLLVSFKLTLGRLAYADIDLRTNEAIAALTVLNARQLDQQYLYWFLTYFDWQQAAEADEKVKGKTLNKAKLRELPVIVPPLDEQQRIVAILDEAFAGLATVTANAEKNLKNARELFYSYLNSVLRAPNDTWKRVSIRDVCDSIVDCPNRTAPSIDDPSPFKMIRTTNVRDGRISLEEVKYVSENVYRRWTRRQIPQKGDVLLTREAPLGEVGMILSDEKVFLGQRLVSYRADPEKLDNHFLLFALQSRDLQKQIHAFGSGATVQHMRVPDSKALMLSVPPLSLQQKVSADLKELSELSERLRVTYEQKRKKLSQLRQSILKFAFAGQLTSPPSSAVKEAAE
ncbi:restriction endonuclease subunit S [Methyloceanibacter sp.]|uniref:restriction endonuclease subunit S n=1 Tax=Methyloceanibacter sp. TaxID=1965321 RepID=UPI003D6D8765